MDSEKAVKAAPGNRFPPLAISVRPDVTDQDLARIFEVIGRQRGCLACGLGGPIIIGPELPEMIRLREIAAVVHVAGPDLIPGRTIGAAGL